MTTDPGIPARPAGPGGTVVRRLSWRPVWQLLGGLAVAVAALGVGAARSWLLAVLAGLFAAIGGLVVLATVRARTELGTDAVRNRALFRTRVIPWSSVTGLTGFATPPRTIRLELADGTRTTLAAIRDRDPATDGLSFDDLLALVHHRANLPDPAATGAVVDDVAGGEVPERVVLRPSRWPVVWLAPVAGVVVAVLVLVVGVWILAVAGYLLVAPVAMLVSAARLLRGRTEVDRDGVRNRLLGRTRHVPWAAVRRIVVVPTLFGRRVKLVLGRNRQVVLAAPRTGLLARDPGFTATVATLRAMARPARPELRTLDPRPARIAAAVALALVAGTTLAVGRPWLEPWWPTRHEAAALPNACAVADAAGAATLVPPPARTTDDTHDYHYFVVSRCARYREPDGELQLELRLDRRVGDDGGTEEARQDYAGDQVGKEPWTALPGLGDEAATYVAGDAEPTVTVLARRANVVVQVEYLGAPDAATARTRATAVARAALDRIRLS